MASKLKIQQQAICLNPTELAELITSLNKALEQKLKVLLHMPKTGSDLKEVIPVKGTGGSGNTRFILEDFLGYEQGKLYLACSSEVGRENYTLFTINSTTVESIFSFDTDNPEMNWREALTPYVIDFFRH